MMIRQFSPIFKPRSTLFPRRTQTRMATSEQDNKSFYDFTARDITGKEIGFDEYRGKVVIVVNAASYCGFTKSNYSGFSDLLDKYYERGLRVLLFPCNQFLNQERDEPEKIKSTIEQYDQRFTIAQKIDVNGDQAHPLWKWLKSKCGGFLIDAIKWNFTKFLIDRNGQPVARFAPNDEPKTMIPKIEELLDPQ